MKIKPENTAISHGHSKSASFITQRENKEYSILDYGCGKMRNAFFLKEKGFSNITVFDIPEQLEKNKAKLVDFCILENNDNTTYDIILNSYVLNVVLLETRNQILKSIKKHMHEHTKCYFEVRTEKDLANIKKPIPYEDGVLTSTKQITTFQKGFTKNELVNLLNNNDIKVLDIIDKGQSLIAIGELL